MVFIIAILVIIVLAIIIAISMYYVVTSKKPEDKKIKYVHQLYEILELCKIESEEVISNEIDEIITTIRYSDVNSPTASRDVETRITEKASELLDNLRSKNSTEVNSNLKELSQLVKERSVITKNNK